MVDNKELTSNNTKTTSKEQIRDLIKQLHEGKNPEEVKMKFKDISKKC